MNRELPQPPGGNQGERTYRSKPTGRALPQPPGGAPQAGRSLPQPPSGRQLPQPPPTNAPPKPAGAPPRPPSKPQELRSTPVSNNNPPARPLPVVTPTPAPPPAQEDDSYTPGYGEEYPGYGEEYPGYEGEVYSSTTTEPDVEEDEPFYGYGDDGGEVYANDYEEEEPVYKKPEPEPAPVAIRSIKDRLSLFSNTPLVLSDTEPAATTSTVAAATSRPSPRPLTTAKPAPPPSTAKPAPPPSTAKPTTPKPFTSANSSSNMNTQSTQTPLPPPRTPPTERRASHVGTIPPLPWREPLPGENVAPHTQNQHNNYNNRAASSPANVVEDFVIPAEVPQPVKTSTRIKSVFKKSEPIEEHQRQQQELFPSSVAPANDQRVFTPTVGQTISSGGVASRFGLTPEQQRLDSFQQASILSIQLNEVNDVIADLLNVRRGLDQLSSSAQGAAHDDVSQKIQEIDEKMIFYNNQLEELSLQLADVNRRLKQEMSTPMAVPSILNKVQRPGMKLELVQAIRDYTDLPNNLKLQYKSGDLITVVEKYPTGWWKGELHDRTGFFQEKNVAPFEYTESSFVAPVGQHTPSLNTTPVHYEAEPVKPAAIQTQGQRVAPAPLASSNSTSNINQPVSIQQAHPTAPTQIISGPIAQNPPSQSQRPIKIVNTPQSGQPRPMSVMMPQTQQIPAPRPVSVHYKQAKALYNFEKHNEGEIDVIKGEIVQVIKEVGVWTCVQATSGKGYVPSNYLEML